MKRHEAKSVGDIIQEAISRTGHRDDFERQQLCYLWADVVGPAINRYTIRRFVDRDVLHVYLSSASLKSELAFRSQSLIDALNATVGKQVITKIVFH